MNRVCLHLAALTIWLLCFSLQPARGQILLKPKGENAAPLRIKSLDARVAIRGQFAQSVLTYVFQNETAERIEADFLYTVPPHATVTYFAYWFGEEKVIARVVEKERAAQIYGYITSRMRDPALIEMVGKNSFRARIFPVMPDADLKIEIHTVQVLPSDKNGATYTLPLRGATPGKGTFEELNVQVQGTLEGAFSGVANNFGQPLQINGASFRFALKQKQYLAPRDLRITLKPHERALSAVIYAAKSGGGDGFFALALSPQSALKKPRVSLSGVKTYDLAPKNLPSVAARGTLLLTGRYKGNGPLAVVLKDGKRQWKTGVQILGGSSANNLAAKLWAARRIEDLSANTKNQEAVIALSQRHTLPSKWTSWLAVPKEEMERYRQEKARADMDYYGRLLAVETAHGRGKSRRASQMRSRFQEAAKLAGNNETLQSWAENHLDDLSYDYQYARGRQKARMRAEMRGLAKLAGVSVNLYYNRARLEAERERLHKVREAQLDTLAERLAVELMQNGDTMRAKDLHRQLSGVARQNDSNPQDWMRGRFYKQTGEVAREWVEQRLLEKPDAARMARLQWRLNLISKYSGADVDDLLLDAERTKIGYGIYSEARELIELQRSAEPDRKRLVELEQKFARFKRLTVTQRALKSARSDWLNKQMHTLTTLLAEEKFKPSPDAARVKELSDKVEKTLDELVATAPHELHQRNLRSTFDYRATNNAANRAIESMKKALDLEQTRRKVQVRQARGIYNNAHKNFPGPPEPSPLESSDYKSIFDKLEDKPGELSAQDKDSYIGLLNTFLRWGDPLIKVQAPRDAQQVIAILPHGEIKKLLWQDGQWQARFDIPTHASEGDFPITVVIVHKDGTRRSVKLHFTVDVTAPKGQGAAYSADEKLRLEVSGDKDTARVSALLPWNEKVHLAASTQNPQRFFAVVETPAAWQGRALQVTYLLTDKAHNRTVITVDLKK
jgi:hypothetical protein